jgi:hypothetical protein
MRFSIICVALILAGQSTIAQSASRMSRREYFNKYKEMAVDEMHRSGVPASITLAQSALESGDGNSTLARNANNHFGIKCHSDWTGKRVYHDDDAKGECFRKYASVRDSYRDHSDYLRSKQRYAFLFDLEITDYKAWARGLKKAGYATSPTYAERLISIIEEFNLHQYDNRTPAPKHREKAVMKELREELMVENRVKYTRARPGDTFTIISERFGRLPGLLCEYNDMNAADSLVPGQIVYLQPKRNKAEMGHSIHILQTGETLWSVSQRYAIKLTRLCSMNLLGLGSQPPAGTELQLRKTLQRALQRTTEEPLPPRGEEEEINIEMNME